MKKRTQIAINEARKQMAIKSSYTIEIEDYIMDIIRKDWTPIYKRHKVKFTPESAIRAMVVSGANDIAFKKAGFDKEPTIVIN